MAVMYIFYWVPNCNNKFSSTYYCNLAQKQTQQQMKKNGWLISGWIWGLGSI